MVYSGTLQCNKSNVLLLGAVACVLGIIATAELQAQPASTPADAEPPEYYQPDHVALTLKVGPVYTMPQGSFPSLLVGESLAGSGEIPSEYAETGSGLRFGLEGLFPLSDRFGILLDLASQRSEIRYRADSTHLPTTMEVQTFQVGAGGIVTLYNADRYTPSLFRSFYLGGSIELGLGPLANRVTSSSIIDTAGSERSEATGSFANNDPFRIGVGLHATAGLRFGLSSQTELLLEGGYLFSLNRFFSSNAIRDNDMKIAHLLLQAGFGIRL